MNRLTSKLYPTDATDKCHKDIFKSDSLKVPKFFFRFSLRAANSLVTSIRQSLSVLCLWVLSIVRLLNLVCVIVERSLVFSLRAEEKDLSAAAVVAGFTRRRTGGHFVCACVNMGCWSATEAFSVNCLRSVPAFAGCFLELNDVYWVLRSTDMFFKVSRYFYDESEFIVASLSPLRGQSFLS